MTSKILEKLVLSAVLGLTVVANAQTLTITNGVQKYASLNSATVNMSGKCELWVTNSATPLSGCIINLNSVDAWLFLPGVKPSVVASSYLRQVRVTGAAAVADSNCRVVQYGQNGAVVVPQSPSFQPLTVYTGPEFTGAARQYGQRTYYTGSRISNISSFKLKRGYMAVLAQSANGANWSKCFIAQDGDLEVGVLPATLNKQVQFIYVTPWRWTPKKGIAGNPGIPRLNVGWWYDWNIDQSSSSDLGYVAIRQNQGWPPLNQNWQSLGINTVLGYNEPDHTDQANLAVGAAIWSWPDLLATGLRVGSPACSDGGVNSWLFPFMSQVSTSPTNNAGAVGMRVDFVAQHYYQGHNPGDPAGCASQMYNFLLNIWNQTHKPIWVTEWNNGANWTDGQWPAPTYAQQQADIAAMTRMLESTPFVERYALYNWVEDTRSLITSSNTVTLAGTVYSNLVSRIGYSQAMPDNGTPGIARYLFETNTWDTSGYYNNGMAIGDPAYTTGHNSQASAIVLDGKNNYVQLPENIADGNAFTFAAWVYWNGGASWQRIFDFGAVSTLQGGTPNQYMFLTPDSSSGTLRFAITTGGSGSEQQINASSALPSGSWQYVAVTLNGSTGILYVNGRPVATASISIAPSAFDPIKNYLGKSQFLGDPLFNGKLDDVEIADYAMTPAQISALYTSGPDSTYTSGVWTNNASGNWGASNNWSGGLIADGVGRMADFSDIDIFSNLTVTLDSARIVGGLRFGDTSGLQNWTLAGTNTLTLDGGGANVPAIAVNQNVATISTPLAGTNGFAKTGTGMLTLTAGNTVGGGVKVDAGTVNISGGSMTLGSGISSIGYEIGSGTMNLSGDSTFTALGNVWVGGSDRNATTCSGTMTLSSGTAKFGGSLAYGGPHYNDGSLVIGAGNNYQNACSGSMTVSGGTVWVTNNLIVGFAGTGTGTLNISGAGTVNVGAGGTSILSVGQWDTVNGLINISGGNLNLLNSSSIVFSYGTGGNNGGGGTNTITQSGGTVAFYSDGGTTVGGSGSLNMSFSGSTNANNTYNLNGGMLVVPRIMSASTTGTRTFNFNGGTLKAAAAGASYFVPGVVDTANVRNGGAMIDSNGKNITIGQALVHSTIGGDAITDGGLTKQGAGTLTLTGVNTYTGPTAIKDGIFILSGSGSIASSRTISISNGSVFDVTGLSSTFTLGANQTLQGNGTVTGPTTILGAIAPGPAIGTLTFGTAPVLSGATLMEINPTNTPNADKVALNSGTLNYGGTLTVANIGGSLQAGDSFQLFSAPGYGGTFAVTNLPSLSSGLAWSNSLAINGSISVVSTVSQTPTNILFSMSSTNLTLSWPTDHTGWRLQSNTNLAGTNWVDVPGSSLTNDMTLPVNAIRGSVFYRMVYP